MTDLREPTVPEVPAPRPRRLMGVLKTSPSTEEAVREITRTLAYRLGRTPTHDEVIAAAVKVADDHAELMIRYMRQGDR